jgi:hypothetical protein
MICRETTLGVVVEIVAGKARRRSGGRSDYTFGFGPEDRGFESCLPDQHSGCRDAS